MTKFKTRINQSSGNSRIILANDYDTTNKKTVPQTIKNIKTLHKFLCGIKLNFHVLLPLGKKEIIRITQQTGNGTSNTSRKKRTNFRKFEIF